MTDRQALIAEGKRLVREQEASGWRLAEIVHELREDGMTYQAIAAELGWKSTDTARGHEEVLSYHGSNLSFADAWRLVRLDDDGATAAIAVAEVNKRAISTTVETRRPEIKAIAAEIADLPQEEKAQVARELANDPGFMSDALAEHARHKVTQETPAPTQMEKTLNTARLRLAINKAEQAAQTVLEGVSRDQLTDEEIESLERASKRARALADYIDAVLGIGDMDKALEALLT